MSALTDAIKTLNEAIRRLGVQASGQGKNMLASALQEARGMVQDAAQKIKKPIEKVNRAMRAAVPVEQLPNGGVLLSDGTIRRDDYGATQALLRRVLEETPYTPQAKAYIQQNVPVTAYGVREASDEMNRSGGYFSHGGGTAPYIGVNVNELDAGPEAAANVMRHEILHALDSALGSTGPSSQLASSKTFMETALQRDPKYLQRLQRSLGQAGIYNPEDRASMDTEGFAYHGSNPNTPMLGPQDLAQQYANVYIPMSVEKQKAPTVQRQSAAKQAYDSIVKNIRQHGINRGGITIPSAFIDPWEDK